MLGLCACTLDRSPLPLGERAASYSGEVAGSGGGSAQAGAGGGFGNPTRPASDVDVAPSDVDSAAVSAEAGVADGSLPLETDASSSADAGRPSAAPPGGLYARCSSSTDCAARLHCTVNAASGSARVGYCTVQCQGTGGLPMACTPPADGTVTASCAAGSCLLGSCESARCPTGMQCDQSYILVGAVPVPIYACAYAR